MRKTSCHRKCNQHKGGNALQVCVLQVATLRSASKDCPKRVATVSRPIRPSPSFRTQLMPAAVGRDLAAPTPTARSRLCMQTLQTSVRKRKHAAKGMCAQTTMQQAADGDQMHCTTPAWPGR